MNIGLAWGRYNSVLVQHFEGDYVEYDRLPAIEDYELSLSDRFKNGATAQWTGWDGEDKGVQVRLYYDPPPTELSRGQLAHTYCYDYGETLAVVLPPPPEGMRYQEGSIRVSETECVDPYNEEVPSQGPNSYREAVAAWRYARENHLALPGTVTKFDLRHDPRGKAVSIVAAGTWSVTDEGFDIKATLPGFLIRKPGVYTVT